MMQKPEWFKMDAAKFLSDGLVDAMSTVELGACFRLLCRQWIDGFIPDDLHLLARLCRLDTAGMREAWMTLSNLFPVMEPGKRANRYMWIEREKVIADLEHRSDEGTRAARKRWEEARRKRDATVDAEASRSPNADASGSPMPEAMQDETTADQPRQESEQTNSEKRRALAQAAAGGVAGHSPQCKRKKRPNLELPEWVPRESWEGFVEMRDRVGAPLTARAMKLIINELAKIRAQGHDPAEVLDQSVMKSWKGVFPVNTNGKAYGHHGLTKAQVIQDSNLAARDAALRRFRQQAAETKTTMTPATKLLGSGGGK